MIPRTLQTRFILAGCLLALATVGSSFWSLITFIQVSVSIDARARESQETIDLTAEINNSLEREDDALLLYISGDQTKARQELELERSRGDSAMAELAGRIENGTEEEKSYFLSLQRTVAAYRTAGDNLLSKPAGPTGLESYHVDINPRLREAGIECDNLRELNFRYMRDAGLNVRNEAARGTRLVAALSVLTVTLGIGVAVWLARSVLRPLNELTESLEQVGRGDFDRRVQTTNTYELGKLADGFNRMVEALAEYRRSSLGELVAAKMTLESTLNTLPDAVLVFKPDGELEATNPPAEKVLTALKAFNANTYRDIPLSEFHRKSIETALSGQHRLGRWADFPNTVDVMLDGHLRRHLLSAVPIPEFSPNRYGAVVVLDDVTEFARLDELRSELIGVASHELKTPLTVVQMNLLMLREEARGGSVRLYDLVEAAVAGCEDLRLTIEELLDVTRIEAGQLRLELTHTDIRDIVSSACNMMKPRFDDAEVRLQVLLPDYPLVGNYDTIRLRCVISNLLSNALKYSPRHGAVEVRLSSRQNAQSGSITPVQIAVTDQGRGVPDRYRERVFEKFFRVDHQDSQIESGVRGTGIGLYLCRKIVAAHNGSIHCEPGPEEIGTQFVITFPVGE